MSEVQKQSANQQYSNNKYYLSETAMQLRLDCSQIIEGQRAFIRGKSIILSQDEKGRILTEEIEFGKPKSNEEGAQAIINRVEKVVNPQSVQGNYTDEQYRTHIAQIRRSVRDNLMINLIDWDIREEDYEDIIDSMMDVIKTFISRLIDNEERKSYAETVKTTEVQSHETGRRWPI